MTEPFGPAYASAYDVFYAGKDYALEVALIEECFARYSAIPVVSVLDLGCGTGSHARLLAAHGFAVTGVDRSGEMLELARAKSAGSPYAIEWIQADLRDLQLNRRYDAATLMFAVLGYFVTDDEARRVLANIRQHLNPGGTLCFDFWYAPAVLAIGPSNRERSFMTPSGETLTRRVASALQRESGTCEVRYEIERDGGTAVEKHVIRYYGAEEMRKLLAESGFVLCSLSAFPTVDEPVGESTWNAFCVARAV